eukprot:TRINITY_DN1445_c0_g3_i1.p1 TRINITY_DN1445_c0_g3~~TRINITY_DN1445_c0_g3_i1.p1  ORF type:complete len:315 (+),score=125.60 TRINITY_DN1445_c0_g3_i1:66-947(+)
MACCVCVDESERGVKQWNGKFEEMVEPGCHCILPCGSISTVNMKVMQLKVHTDTKTKDDVTVTVESAVQWAVDPDAVETFYFKVSDPDVQIAAFVDDIIRSELPIRTLDESFAEKTAMGQSAEQHLRQDICKPFGINIIRVLITDLRPDPHVLRSMNEINAAKREREAARERAEAQRILTVVAAEAEAEARQLSGKGLANMRREIACGFKNSIVDLTGKEDADTDLSAQSVVHMMLVTQYLDVLKDFAVSGKSSMVVPHGAGFIGDVENQIRNGFWQASHLRSSEAAGPGAGR